MKYLLDTNAWISYLRNPGDTLAQRLASEAPGDVALCSVCRLELLFGILRSPRHRQQLPQMQLMFRTFRSLPLDDAAAETCAQLRMDLERIGQPIGPYDGLIAAIALTHSLTLVTHNTREFSRIPGLQLEDWQ